MLRRVGQLYHNCWYCSRLYCTYKSVIMSNARYQREGYLEDYQKPELLRTRLEEVILQIKMLKLGKAESFLQKSMECPELEAIHHALQLLNDIGALDDSEELTPLGYHLARMPVDPQCGKMLLLAAMFCCLEPVASVAACLSYKEPFVIPLGKESDADRKRLELSRGSCSDHLMYVNTFREYLRARRHRDEGHFCWDNFISQSTIKLLLDMRRQFADLLYDLKFISTKDVNDAKANINSDNLDLVRAIICAGLYPNVAKKKAIRREDKRVPIKLHCKGDVQVKCHPKSVNCINSVDQDSLWFVYHTKVKGDSGISLHDTSMVSTHALLMFGGQHMCCSVEWESREAHCARGQGAYRLLYYTPTEPTRAHDNQPPPPTATTRDVIIMDKWIVINAHHRTAQIVMDLRSQLDSILLYKASHPGITDWDVNSKQGAILTAILRFINSNT